MKTVVITGSTRGIGRGLAESFLDLGCQVVISGRREAVVQATVQALSDRFPGKVGGVACDVTDVTALQRLWDEARNLFGRVDIWINNAGMSIARKPLSEADPQDIAAIVNTNLTGILLANRVVLAGMQAQGAGQIWNMEGFGSNGMTQVGMIPYGATKRAVNYLIKGLQKEVKGTPLQVCTLSPGIVVTDLLVGDYDQASEEWAKAKRIFNILGDTVETVTPWLARQVLATDKSGAKVEWLTTGKAFSRFMTAAFNKRDLFANLA